MTFFDDTEVATRYGKFLLRRVIKQGTRGAVSQAERSWADADRETLITKLLTKLSSGTLIARGFVPGSVELTALPTGWWESASISPETGTAEAAGTVIAGVLIFEADVPVSKAPEPLVDRTIDAGGRTRQFDRSQFAIEYARFIGEHPGSSIRAVNEHMRLWASSFYSPAPSSAWVRDQTAKLRASRPRSARN